MKATLKQIAEMKSIHSERGLNAVNGYIKRNNIDCTKTIYDFGTGKAAACNKVEFLNYKEKRVLRFHYASRLVHCKNGFGVNCFRGVEFEF